MKRPVGQDIVVALSLCGGTLCHRMVNEGQMWILQVTNDEHTS